jgi:hypothetical protein
MLLEQRPNDPILVRLGHGERSAAEDIRRENAALRPPVPCAQPGCG